MNRKIDIFKKIEKKEIKKSINDPGSEGEDRISDGAAENLALVRFFRAFFNNKMTVLIFLCRSGCYTPTESSMDRMGYFLDDLYRHMLGGNAQRLYRRKFIWFKGFLRKLPHVRPSQRATAFRLIRSLYETFGLSLALEKEGVE